MKYVPYTDRKEVAKDLKTIYQASTDEQGYENLIEVEAKWGSKYPGMIKSWKENWNV